MSRAVLIKFRLRISILLFFVLRIWRRGVEIQMFQDLYIALISVFT